MSLSSCARVLLAASCVAALLVVGCGSKRAEQYRQQGDTYFRLDKYAEAEEAYRNATETDPENADAKLGLARCMVIAGKPDEALAYLQEITNQAPKLELAYLEAANLLAQLGRPDEALAYAQQLEVVNPESGGVLHASLLLRAGQTDQALASLKALRDAMPESTLVRSQLACALLAAGEPLQAEAELNTALEKQPDSVGPRFVMVEALDAQGKIGEFIAQREQYQSQGTDQIMALAYALVRGDSAQEEEGLLLMQQALQQDPTSAWANFAFGSYLIAKGQPKDAATPLRTAAHALPWEPLVLRGVSVDQKPALASSAPSQPATPEPTGEAPASIAASTETWQSLWRQAALGRLLEERQRFTAAPSEHLQEKLVLAAHIRGDIELAKELAVGLPADSPLHAFLQALENKDPKLAVDALKPWDTPEDPSKPWDEATRLERSDLQLMGMNAAGHAMAIAGARGKAVQVLSACSKRYPDNAVSMLIIAQIFRSASMPEFAAQTLKTLTAAFPDNHEAHLLRFQILREAGMLEDARQAAEIMYALFPGSREATLAVTSIYMDLKRSEHAKRVVEGYQATHPDDPEMQLTLAAILVRENHVDEALKVLSAIEPPGAMAPGIITLTALAHATTQNWQGVIEVAEPADPQTMSVSARFILAAAYITKDLKDKAAAILMQPGQEKPFGGTAGEIVLQALGHASADTADKDQALTNTLATDPGALVDFAAGAAFQLAKFHDNAYQAFSRVDAALPADSDYLLSLMFHSLPNAALVEDVAQEAQALAAKHADNPATWLACAVILQRLEDVAAERIALDKAAEAGPDNPMVYQQRGDFFARQDDLATAITQYRRVLELRPEDPVASNNLAYYLLLTGGDTTEALNAAQLAAKGLPNEPRILHTLGVAQLRAGDLEQSKKNLTMALESMPGNPSLLLDYGQLMIKQGDVDQGRRTIENALITSNVLGLDFDRKAEAEKILSELPAPVPEPVTPGAT